MKPVFSGFWNAANALFRKFNIRADVGYSNLEVEQIKSIFREALIPHKVFAIRRVLINEV